MGLGSTLNLSPTASPPLYHLYITSSPPTQNPSSAPINHSIASVHITSSHSPLFVLTYYPTYRSLLRRPTDSGLRWRRKHKQTLSQEKKRRFSWRRKKLEILSLEKKAATSDKLSRTLNLPHLSTIASPTSLPPLQSQNSKSSRHVKAFSTIRVDLLSFISVTVATSHWFRSPYFEFADAWSETQSLAAVMMSAKSVIGV